MWIHLTHYILQPVNELNLILNIQLHIYFGLLLDASNGKFVEFSSWCYLFSSWSVRDFHLFLNIIFYGCVYWGGGSCYIILAEDGKAFINIIRRWLGWFDSILQHQFSLVSSENSNLFNFLSFHKKVFELTWLTFGASLYELLSQLLHLLNNLPRVQHKIFNFICLTIHFNWLSNLW